MTSNTDLLIQHSLETLSCNQKELAKKLGVSQSQITMWKKGEPISDASISRFSQVLGVSEDVISNIDLVKALHGVKNFEMWVSYADSVICRDCDIGELQFDIRDSSIYDNNSTSLLATVLETFVKAGVEFPKDIPDLIADYATAHLDDNVNEMVEEYEEQGVEVWELEANDFHYRLLSSFTTALSGYLHVIDKSDFNEGEVDLEEVFGIEYLLIEHAALYAVTELINEDARNKRSATTVSLFKASCSTVQASIDRILISLLQSGTPVKVDLNMILTMSPEDIHQSSIDSYEKEILGVEEPRLHPDVFINELLVSSRRQTVMLERIYQALALSQDREA